MKKVIKLTESDLNRLVIKTINEMKNNEKSQGIKSSITEYQELLKNLQKQKEDGIKKLMEDTVDNLNTIMSQDGWSKKGKNTITDVMIKNRTRTSKFSKKINGEDVVVELKGNMKDEFLPWGLNIISCPLLDYKGYSKHPFDWDEKNVDSVISLSNMLKHIG
jgi:CRISPR/Cas system CMR subunit Cmr4 (Cas7 group RAMP superfamily)